MLTSRNQSIENSIVLLSYVTPFAFAWFCVALFLGFQMLVLAAGIIIFGFLVGIVLHHLGWHLTARFSYLLIGNGAIALAALVTPFESFVSFILVAAAIAPFVVFSLSEHQRPVLGFVLLPIVLWLAIWAAHSGSYVSPDQYIEADNTILSLTSAITVFSVVLFVIGFYLRNAQVTSERLRAAMVGANKAREARKNLLQSVSHEMLTPLHAISGFADILRFDAKAGKQIKQENIADYSDQIVKSSQEMFRMIETMMDFVNFDGEYLREDFTKIPVEKCLKSVAERFSTRLEEKRLEIQYDIDPDLLVLGDEGGLGTIFNQLLDNAVKFSRSDGYITISSSRMNNGTAELLIMDNGPGFPTGASKKVFVPFERMSYATSATSGFGVGLSLSQSIARAMGFEIAIDETAMDGGHVRLIFASQTEPARG